MKVGIVTSEKSVSLQRVANDVSDVLAMNGIKVARRILSPNLDPYLYKDLDAVVVVMTFDPFWAVGYFLICHTAISRGKKCVFYTTIEGLPIRYQNDQWIYRDLQFIANSRFTAECLGVSGARVRRVIYHGIDVSKVYALKFMRDTVRDELGIRPDDFMVLYVAGAYMRKGHQYFAQVARAVSEKDPSIKFVVLTQPKAMKYYLGLNNTLVLTSFGELDETQIYGLYHACDLYAQASLCEGFGLPCLPPGSPIITIDGIKPIEEIREGELVLTHKGRFMRVTKTMERPYRGKIVKISIWGNRAFELVLTPEHPVLAIRRPKKKGRMTIGRTLSEGKVNIEWLQASELRKGDIVLFPIPKQLFSVELIDLHEVLEKEGIKHECDNNYIWLKLGYSPRTDISYSELAREAGVRIGVVKYVFKDLLPKGEEPRSEEHRKVIEVATRLGYNKPRPKKYPRYIKDVKKLARLLGYYTAEGSIVSEGHAVEFSFGGDEEDMVREVEEIVKELFNDTITIYRTKDKNVIRVVLCGLPYAALVKQCGVGAHNKRIPTWILYGDIEVLREFVDAYLKGDGSVVTIRNRNKVSTRICASTASKQLAIDLKIALLRLGFKPTVRVNKRKDGHIEFVVSAIKENVGVTHSNKSWFVGSEYIGFLIDEVEMVDYDGMVYNLEVEEDNSYTTPACSVHNCLEALSAGKAVIHPDYAPLSEITSRETSFRVPVKAKTTAKDVGGILFLLHHYDPKEYAEVLLQAKEEVMRRRTELEQACVERAREFDYRETYKAFIEELEDG